LLSGLYLDMGSYFGGGSNWLQPRPPLIGFIAFSRPRQISIGGIAMAVRFILTEYVNQLMAHALYDKLEDGTFAGRIPQCKGVVAFGATLRECEDELRSTLEDWILVGLKLGHPLPVIAEIDLNRKPTYEPVDTV